MWREVREKVGWRNTRNKTVAELFAAEEAVEAILQLLKDTDIGKVRQGALHPPTPEWGGEEAGMDEREEERGREYLSSLG